MPLARALHAGGLSVIEVTLRTPVALAACAAIAKECPEVVLGIGTILTPDQVKQAVDVGAQFLVTPGTSEKLARAVADSGVAALPGSGTLSRDGRLDGDGLPRDEVLPGGSGRRAGLSQILAGPIPELRFCPTAA